ncbi:MAG: hypothetical protein GX786_09525 [Clostridiales bacterium]|nr:hypothetical protein [Clostridiales bacterium]
MLSEEGVNIPAQNNVEEGAGNDTPIIQGDEGTSAFEETTHSTSRTETVKPTVFNDASINKTENDGAPLTENGSAKETKPKADEDTEINISDERATEFAGTLVFKKNSGLLRRKSLFLLKSLIRIAGFQSLLKKML